MTNSQKFRLIALLLFVPVIGFSQDLKTVFLDSIDVNDHIQHHKKVDTLIDHTPYSIRIDFSEEICIFGNLDEKGRPDGNWIFKYDDPFEYVMGSYHKGKRDGAWYIGCRAKKIYKRGKAKSVTMCPY